MKTKKPSQTIQEWNWLAYADKHPEDATAVEWASKMIAATHHYLDKLAELNPQLNLPTEL